jgi:hypothetical protein
VEARKLLIRIITFIGGLFFLLEFVIPGRPTSQDPNFLTPFLPTVMDIVVVVGTLALLLGPINLVRSHWKRISKRQKGTAESLVFLVFLAAGILAAGFYYGLKLDKAPSDAVLTSVGQQAAKTSYSVAYYGIQLAFGASSMGLLSFYLISAAYRSFRLNNLESSVMMASAVIVLLGLVPLGNWMTGGLPASMQLSTWTAWLLGVPNTAVQRAVLVGAVGGAFAAGLRHWLGLGRRVE